LIDQPQPADWGGWRQLLNLGQQLMAEPMIAAQRDLILEMAARLVGGRADLWLAEALRWLPGWEELASSPTVPPSDLMRRVFDTRRILCSEEIESDLDTQGQAHPPSVAAPLLAPDVVLGVLQIERPGGPPFSDVEIELIDGLATQSALALQSARQVAIERWRVEQLSLVRMVSAQVANALGLDDLFPRVADLILRTFEYYYVALFTLEPGQETLRFRASAGPIRPRPDGGPRVETAPRAGTALRVWMGEGIIGHVAQTGLEILANDVSCEPRYRYEDALPETRSEVALPLKIENHILGVLDVQSNEPGDFDETDVLVLRALAHNISIAVEDARLYGDLRRRADQLSAVAAVSRAVASTLDLDALFNRIVTLIHERFDYPFVHLFTVDPGRRQILYRAGSGPRSQSLCAQELAYSLDDPQGIIPWVARHGETVLANDVSREPRYRPSELPPANTRAELAVPLVFGGEVLGVLDLQSDRRDAFGDDDRFLFEALADEAAIAIRNANLYRSERWRRQVADSLREVAGLLSADVALDQVLEAILVELERTLPCDVAAIWLVQDDDLHLAAVHGCTADDVRRVMGLLSDADSWLDQALHADQPTIRTPGSPFEPLGSAMDFPPDYSAIAAPLRAGDRRLGLLVLVHRASGRYGTESRAMTAAFASYAAVAIENTRLYEAAQEQAWVSTVLLQVAEATQSLTTLDEVLETVVRLVPMLIGVARCAVLLSPEEDHAWGETTEAFVPVAAYGLSPSQQAAFNRWCIAPGDVLAFDRLRLVKAPIIIRGMATDPQLSETVVPDLGFESLLLLPLLARGEVLGAMLVDYRDDQTEFSKERLAIMRGVAYQAAAAVENARLLEALQQEVYVSAALLQVAQAVVSFSDLDDILGAIVRIAPILVGVEWCIIFLWDDSGSLFRPVQAYGFPRSVEVEAHGRVPLLARGYAPGDFPLLDAVRERNSLMTFPADTSLDDSVGWGDLLPSDFVADFAEYAADASSGQHRAQQMKRETRSLLAVPLSVQDDVLGVMLVEEVPPLLRRSNEKRLEIIKGIAQQAALAVQNDRLQQEQATREQLERELQLAREIQQTFMPSQLPHLPDWELAVAWRAARQVGGDFYDFFELPGGRLGLVIADVADKGMPAALFMALTRALVRAAALEDVSPAAVLARVNDLLVPDAQQGMFVTAVYAVLSLETGHLAYANAGHNLPLLLRSRARELEQLGKGGMALGVLEGTRLEERVISLERGDYLVFYTDGVTEAFSAEEEIYGEGRLRAIIQAADGGSVQAMLDAINDSVTAFVGDNPPSDDITLMVLHRLVS
jgi:sigma-B regulation protein RsbU (phosphoserine phosphatase)